MCEFCLHNYVILSTFSLFYRANFGNSDLSDFSNYFWVLKKT